MSVPENFLPSTTFTGGNLGKNQNQLLQLYTAPTTWSDSLIRPALVRFDN